MSVDARLDPTLADDYADAATIVALDGTVPALVRRRFGFRSNDALPFSKLTQPAAFVVCPLSAGLDDCLEMKNWSVEFSDIDTR